MLSIAQAAAYFEGSVSQALGGLSNPDWSKAQRERLISALRSLQNVRTQLEEFARVAGAEMPDLSPTLEALLTQALGKDHPGLDKAFEQVQMLLGDFEESV